MTRLEVPAEGHGQRLDVWLAGHLGISRSRAAARIDAGEVTIAGGVAPRRRQVHAGEVVVVTAPVPVTPSEPPPVPPIRYRDEHLLVLAKPAGLIVHPGAGHPDGTLVEALRGAGIPLADTGDPVRPGIVHRLDRDTSGLLLIASSQEAAVALSAALAAREVRRRYYALVAGVPANPRGRIEAPIGRDPSDRLRFAVVTEGRDASTRYRTLATGQAPDLPGHRGAVASLACQLGTGRTHQLRVHLTALGHPIVGDPTYRPPAELTQALGARRPVLHAAALALDHPVTGAPLRLFEPLPDDLVAVLARAGLVPPSEEDLVGER